MNLYGAVDLSGLAASPPAGAGAPGAAGQPTAPGATVPGPLVVDVTEATFGETVQRSTQVPVLVDLASPRSDASATLTPVLEKLVREYGGRFQLAKVDVDANPQIAAAFQVQSVPTVIALIGGQPVPLFQGAYPEQQIRQVLDEVLKVAAQNGVTGVVAGEDEPEAPEVPEEPPLPPLHAEALEAIERGDLEAAESAYTRAVKENPRDAEAHAALLQVQLIRRVDQDDPEEVLARADATPTDVAAQLAAADVEATTGQFGAAFTRLLALVRATAGDEREQARLRLLDLFEIAGPTHPDVAPARRQLASALY
ncbi:tetratricopeptide repeat protein [Georgenia subflava]|uniref:Tetratricopeptide repeat protein n=2 Tax=Georgenia subflava TaxID=1622177 RepID=A0A6N7EM45_9MICO|nr:tetratricopeptide repeat protein [Georgenia subflava]